MKIEPEITLRVDASVELNGRFKATTVATISLGGYDFRFSKIDVEWKNVEFDGEIFLFFNLKPTISVEETVLGAELHIVKLLIYMPMGVRLKFLDATMDLPDADLPDKKHTCNVCFKIPVDFVRKYSFRIMFLNSPKLGLDIPLCGEKSNPLFRMYWSLDYGEFEKGDCPHYVYKLTASVTDNEGEAISGASVSVEEKQASTNDQGIAVLYLPAEKYKVTAVSGNLSASKSVKIEDACKVTFCLSEEEEDEPSNDWWDDIDFEGIWDSGNNGDLTDESADEEMTYNDHKYALFDISMTWTEARAYCENLGGHLVTITSPEEQAFIEVLIDGGLKSQYWLGMYRSQGNLVWVTGEKISYTNWDSNQPDRVHAFGGYEDYVEILRVPHNCCGASSYRYRWNDIYNDNDNHCKSYTPNSVGFICEFESTPKQAPTLDAIYGGEYSTEVTDTYTLKTASFTNLVPGAQYILLAMVSTDVDNPLSADNLLYIDQAVAEEDGSLVFHYVQRTPVDISYVVACGASSKNLSDAEITFPEMEADGEIRAVNPTVVYDGKTLTEGQDYTIAGTVSFTEPGTYTCYIRGVRNYTGLVECVYSVNGGVEEIASGWSGDTTWVLTNDGVLTFSGTGNMKNYGYNGGQPWLNKGVDITSVVIEDGVASVGSGAFKDLTSLKSVTLPETLTKMGEAAFYGSGLESVEIPASLWTIQPYTFKNCINLKSVKFNEGNLQKISDGAFYGTGLTELVLPDCLDIMDVYAFKGCETLTSITIGSGLTELREAVFYGTAIPTITIPEGITKIGPYVFKRCAKLETVNFPSTLTSVGEAAFYEATALKTVELPVGVTTIGNYAFRKCAAIETLKLSENLVTIGECAFYGCTSLTELVIPDKVTTIKPYAFKTCTGLISVTLGNSVENIGEGAFNTCTGIKTIVFPASLKTIGDYCFSGSVNLWKLTFLGDAPSIGTGTFKGLNAYAYYPEGNATWTSDVMQNYGGMIIWEAN